jgi:hypothetical protein
MLHDHKHIKPALTSVPTFPSHPAAVTTLKKAGLDSLARAELINEEGVRLINTFSGLTLTALPTLLLEFHTSSEQATTVTLILAV